MPDERTPQDPGLEPVHADPTVRATLASLNDDQRLHMLGALYAITAKTGAYSEKDTEVIQAEEAEIREFFSQLKPELAPKPTFDGSSKKTEDNKRREHINLPLWVQTKARLLNDIAMFIGEDGMKQLFKLDNSASDNLFQDLSWMSGGYLTLLSFEAMPFLKNAFPTPTSEYQKEEAVLDDIGASYGVGSQFTKEGNTAYGYRDFIKELGDTLLAVVIDKNTQASPANEPASSEQASPFDISPPKPGD